MENEIVLYQPDELTKLEVRVENETVWLSQAQIVELFASSKANISEHIKNIYVQHELEEESTVRDFRTVQKEGNRYVSRSITYYNLDAIISIGFRVNTHRGIQFRQWANKVLKDYMLRGYAVNQRIERLEQKVAEHDKKIDFFVRTSLPPMEGVFYDGQIFDAYVFVSDLIKSAKNSVLLIDNYIDESVFTLLDKRTQGVQATIYTQSVSKALRLDLEKHNAQYRPIEVCQTKAIHDRFLIIDETVYHIGASMKDLGKRLFAFSKMEVGKEVIIERV